jgi:hypothetical protein
MHRTLFIRPGMQANLHSLVIKGRSPLQAQTH